MSDERALVKRHFEALLREAEARGAPPDVIGRIALEEVVAIWKRDRPWPDIAAELEFAARGLDPDADFEFMRP